MRYLVFSDIHGNLEALERALEETRRSRADLAVSLGDVVGYGASPDECVALVQEIAQLRIGGNHDVAAAGLIETASFSETAREALRWTSRAIAPRTRELLGEYDTVRRHGDCVFAHASPVAPMDWEYVRTLAQADVIFARTAERFVFVGHTHVPGIIERHGNGAMRVVRGPLAATVPGCRYLVNVGSVGQPRDGVAAASYAILDTRKELLTIRRVPYDIRGAQDRIRSAGLPETLAERLATAR